MRIANQTLMILANRSCWRHVAYSKQ